MDFSDALREVKAGRRVAREMWTEVPRYGRAVFLMKFPEEMQVTDQLMMTCPDGVIRPFAGANWDLLADDWNIVS